MATQEQIASWAKDICFTATDIDCTTAVVLKILDQKCKMESIAMHAVVMLYDIVKTHTGKLLGPDVHQTIQIARSQPTDEIMLTIHTLRVHAESVIDKPVMKAYKQMLRQGLSKFS